MRSKLLTVVGAVLCAATASLDAQKQLELYASIVDGSGAQVAEVQPGDLRLLENDVEAKVLKVEAIDWPVKVQLLVDNGVGLGAENIIHLRNGIQALLEALPENVEVTIVTTAPQPRFLVRATTNRQELLGGLGRLSPDSGTGRFVESLNEATQRIERDKENFFPVIISVGTFAGDNNVMERDVQRLMERLQKRPTTVHVALLATVGRSAGGANQTQVGKAVADYTRGRFESIAAASRIATLLPEIGGAVAKSAQGVVRQFKITAERPGGASGDLGKISMGTRGTLQVKALSLDAPRLP